MQNALGAAESAIEHAVAASEAQLAYLVYTTEIDNLQVAPDNRWAIGWLVPQDPDTGEPIPAEPGLALLRNDGGVWDVSLPGNPRWADWINQIPPEMLSEDIREMWQQRADLQAARAAEAEAVGPFGGYRLPWAAGKTILLTQSVHHDRYTPSLNAHYAFDFSTSPSALFDLYAAKGGTVWKAKWDCANGNESCSNYLVLEDPTTTPTTYQLYLHLAQDSIPVELRQIGTRVVRGQFIGIADDTGASTNHHLHFHVHTYPTSYWGASVDITFEDVAINGGRPRISADLPYCRSDSKYQDQCSQTTSRYTSGNRLQDDLTPPVGALTAPAYAATISSPTVRLQGWASDDKTGLAAAQFLAYYNDQWHDLPTKFNASPFALDWDMCADGVPDGPVSLALRLQDNAFNFTPDLTGQLHFTKNYACPVPLPTTCTPAANQAALFAEIDFSGTCQVFNVGSFTSAAALGAVGPANAASIAVGADVQVSLYRQTNLRGRGETFLTADANLADNLIGADALNSLLVTRRDVLPSTPLPLTPANGLTLPADLSLSLVWDNGGSSTRYQVLLNREGAVTVSDWLEESRWHLGALASGRYTWQVKAGNAAGESGWSAARTFTIPAPTVSGVMLTAPVMENMEGSLDGWIATSNWDLGVANHTPAGAYSWEYDTNSASGYDTGAANSGSLTSPPVLLPANEVQYLRFWSYAETETGGRWDQRWLQIAVGDGPFANIYQLQDDPTHFWVQSEAISLADYLGQTIRLRFHFETLDSLHNGYTGWKIDDLSLTSEPPLPCADGNRDPASSQFIDFGQSKESTICPGGDVDFYQFAATAGDTIGAWVEAQDLGSAFDPTLRLLDGDGRSLLAANDDLVHGERTDAALTYRVTRSGVYYLRVAAWNHPTAGGYDQTYRMHLFRESQDPSVQFISPQEGGFVLRHGAVRVSASDASGVAHVLFLWHSSDWINGAWQVLGDDWDGRDGWSTPFAPEARGTTVAVYAIAFDWAGNWLGAGAWNLSQTNSQIHFPLIPR
jgi:murein DD-endopeptidase MepM/ murein hydrolase activator NlpD